MAWNRRRDGRQRPGEHTLLLATALSLGGALSAGGGRLLLRHGGKCCEKLAKVRDASLARCIKEMYATGIVASF
jgi:hypothetical protein